MEVKKDRFLKDPGQFLAPAGQWFEDLPVRGWNPSDGAGWSRRQTD